MMHVDVDVQHARVELEHFNNGEHRVVDVTEARGLVSSRVVEASRPVDRNVRAPVNEAIGSVNGPSRQNLTVRKDAVEDRAIVLPNLADVVVGHFFAHAVHILRTYLKEEIDVFFCVKLLELRLRCLMRFIAAHLLVQFIPQNELVRDLHTMRLEGMVRAIIEGSDLRVMEICNLVLHPRRRHLSRASSFQNSQLNSAQIKTVSISSSSSSA
mmetsp:Transcript_21174/g.50087  ORF Transcript_21174/g.50087 Transcript_21174/m.50087 type:complete len:212 (+) Transcript_21174:839-1474(+)